MGGSMTATAGPRIFRGWSVLAGIFVILTAGSGFAFYAQGVLLDAFVDEQGFTVSMAGAGTGFFFLVSGIGGYYAGGLMGRFDIRLVMTVGATIAAIGILLLGRVRTEWHMFAVFAIYGVGYSLSGLVPATSLVTRWFHVRRSVALSIASTGLSVGGIAITPVLAQLIDRRSLVEFAPQFAIAYWLCIVPVTVILIRPSPEALGLRPDGVIAQSDEPVPAPAGVPFAVAVRTRFFRLVSVGFILVMAAQVGSLQHLFKLTKDAVGVDTASLVLIVLTTTSIVARLLGGLVASRVPLINLTSVLIAVQAVGIAIIGATDERWVILFGTFVLGVTIGNLLMLHPLLLADAFGVADYPRVYGLGSLLMVGGVGLGPLLIGITRDLSSYRLAYYLAAIAALFGLVVFRLAGRPDQSWTIASAATADPSAQDSVRSSDRSEPLLDEHLMSDLIGDLVDDNDLPSLIEPAPNPVVRRGPPQPPDALRISAAVDPTATVDLGPRPARVETDPAATTTANGASAASTTPTATATPIDRGGQPKAWLMRVGAAGSMAATVAIYLWLRGRSAGDEAQRD